MLQFDELLWNGFPLSIVILGLSHQSAPLELLEKSTIPSEDLPKKLTDLMQQDHISEAVVISTCNRTEIYVVAEKFHAAYAEVRDFVESQNLAEYELPLFASKVAAGLPSPADDFMDTKLDLNTHLIKTPSATFFVRVSGQSMINAGIHDGDLLVVDRSIEPQVGKIVIAAIQHELTVKRYVKKDGKVY